MKKILILILIALASCKGNVERVGEDKPVVLHQPTYVVEEPEATPEADIQLGGTLTRETEIGTPLTTPNTAPYVDESMYPFGDKRLRKHKDFDYSVLIEEPNKWNAEVIRIIQEVDYWMILNDTYTISTAVAVGKLDGTLILFEINLVDNGISEYEKSSVMEKQLKDAHEVMKKLAYKLNKLN